LSPPDREPAHTLTLLTRAECGLCEDMLNELQALRARHALPPLRLLDVDSDPQLQRRYGLKIPVLLLDQIPVCSARLDQAELLRALRALRDRSGTA
jgi:hypothetical protein